jgi:hypothetical protein
VRSFRLHFTTISRHTMVPTGTTWHVTHEWEYDIQLIMTTFKHNNGFPNRTVLPDVHRSELRRQARTHKGASPTLVYLLPSCLCHGLRNGYDQGKTSTVSPMATLGCESGRTRASFYFLPTSVSLFLAPGIKYRVDAFAQPIGRVQ